MSDDKPQVFYDEAAGMYRVRVKTVGDYHVEIIPMLVNWRLHTIRVDAGPLEWSHRFWCYDGRDEAAFVAAVLAAMAWDGADDTEPAGWIKSHDGRYGGRLAGTIPVRM